ncbi:helix-turn-helix transcriptional regulator [Escherichia coli]
MLSDFIYINNIRFNFYVIVLASNCTLDIESDGRNIKCHHNSFILFERNVVFSARIKKIDANKAPYILVKIDRDTLKKLKNIFFGVHGVIYIDESKMRDTSDKIINSSNNDELIELYEKISICNDVHLKLTKIALFLSKLEKREKIIESIYISSASYFSDKVRNLIEKDLTIKWKLGMIADKFNISEITVRKRLESEKNTFNQLLMQCRMNKAAELILENEYQISQISTMIGISNPSYFIKNFKEYFSVTPKKFFNYFRR